MEIEWASHKGPVPHPDKPLTFDEFMKYMRPDKINPNNYYSNIISNPYNSSYQSSCSSLSTSSSLSNSFSVPYSSNNSNNGQLSFGRFQSSENSPSTSPLSLSSSSLTSASPIITSKTQEPSPYSSPSSSLSIPSAPSLSTQSSSVSLPLSQHDDSGACCVCKSARANVLVRNCKHLCLCSECSSQLETQKYKTCPLCNTPFKRLEQIFLS
jgi:hypothetical protein